MESNDNTGNERIRTPQSSAGAARRDSPVDLWSELDQMRRRMDDLFGHFFGSAAVSPPASTDAHAVVGGVGAIEPDMDVYENDTEFVIHAALPGVDPHDIHVEATEKSIHLTAERSAFSESPEHAADPGVRPAAKHLKSRLANVARFSATYTLPSEIDPAAARAEVRHGQLELHLPKRDVRTSRAVAIPVNAMDAPRAGQPAISSAPGQGAMEGNPAAKIGASYNPTAGEDHTAKVQSINEREDHGVGLKSSGR